MDFDNDFEYYVLHFRYKQLHFKHGFNAWQGFHIFKNKEDLMSYVNLEEGSLLDAVYNDDNTLRRSNNEILIYAEDNHGRSVWESDLLRIFAEIKDFFYREFGNQDTSYDVLLNSLHDIPLAYTTLTDEEIPIQFVLDIIDAENMNLKVFLNDSDEPERISSISLSDLEEMTFDELIDNSIGYTEEDRFMSWQRYIEDVYLPKQNMKDNYKEENLAEETMANNEQNTMIHRRGGRR